MKLELFLELYANADDTEEQELLEAIAREIAIHLTCEMITLGLDAKAKMGIEY